MAGIGLLALIDDIATLLDDVAILTKVAAKKTAGVLGDDLALNAEQVSGVRADRELSVVWAVAKGSAINKVVLVPAALLISAFIPWLITPLLMFGGAFLCFEGFEKIAHYFEKGKKKERIAEHDDLIKAISDTNIDMVSFEKQKIKGAIRTDFILSAEIVVIVLGSVQEASFNQQVLVVSLLAALITVGVYGVVAAIVKLDDLGLYLMKSDVETLFGPLNNLLGRGILSFCPHLMKTLSIVGTAAMFLVGGGILVHGVHMFYEYILQAQQVVTPYLFHGVIGLLPILINAVIGIVIGGVIYGTLLCCRYFNR